MTQEQTAREFFDACETGKGWDVCKPFCHDDATFKSQADALADITTLQAYTEWMKGLLVPIPDGRYELKAFAANAENNCVVGAAVFHGTHTAEGGPVPATGNSVSSDYVYIMNLQGDKIKSVTKIWNDVQALRALGWA